MGQIQAFNSEFIQEALFYEMLQELSNSGIDFKRKFNCFDRVWRCFCHFEHSTIWVTSFWSYAFNLKSSFCRKSNPMNLNSTQFCILCITCIYPFYLWSIPKEEWKESRKHFYAGSAQQTKCTQFFLGFCCCLSAKKILLP